MDDADRNEFLREVAEIDADDELDSPAFSENTKTVEYTVIATKYGNDGSETYSEQSFADIEEAKNVADTLTDMLISGGLKVNGCACMVIEIFEKADDQLLGCLYHEEVATA